MAHAGYPPYVGPGGGMFRACCGGWDPLRRANFWGRGDPGMFRVIRSRAGRTTTSEAPCPADSGGLLGKGWGGEEVLRDARA